jgi:class 3 adenylate cyclase/tetratricopeptide (TPR) repeat protein
VGANRCPQCGAELPSEARFCAYCGVPITAATPSESPRDERRVITALFADIAGSTQLGERLDPEDFRDLTDGALSRMGSAIEGLGGTVRGTAGDGILGLFGAPTAHEDDAERAVLAGLRLVEALGAYGREAAQQWNVGDFHVRVGIETGLAVVGQVRAGSHVQYDASGDCLNTAARLEGAADVDGVLVGPTTHRLVREAFDWSEQRPLALKGKAQPVAARHALSSRGDRPRSGAAPTTRLVGRDQELALAGEILAQVKAGESSTVFVTGVAGIGKTRFMGEVRSLFMSQQTGAPAAIWLEGSCVSYGLDEPFLPFRQVLRQALGDRKPGADRIASMLEMILGLPMDEADSIRIAALSAETLQQSVIESFADLVVELSAQGPVAVALDDLHWADAASLRLAEGLIARLATEPGVLMVLGMRSDTERPSWTLREQGVAGGARELRLAALDQDAERGLISSLVGAGTLPEELESRLLQRAEGNPFYLGELLRSLRDTGAIVKASGGWSFDGSIHVELPDTVERVVLTRVDRLPAADRDLLDSAAVLGREFDLPLLGRVARTRVTPGSLANLIHLGLFEKSLGEEFRFSHPLIQETAYSSMLRRGRRALHARAAAAIEELAVEGSGAHHAVLARHHSAAGHPAEAITYHRLAAIDALRVVASGEARNQLDLAIAAAATLEESAVRRRLPELYLLRGRARGRLGDYVGGIADLRQSLEGAQVVADRPTEMGALNDLGWLLRAHNYEESINHHRQALSLAEELHDPATQVTALSRMSMIELNRLRLDRGLELAERALVIARATPREELLGAALDCLKLAALHVGDLELLERTVAEIVEVQDRTGDLYLLQWAHLESATVPLAHGDVGKARDRITIATEINSRFVSDPVAAAMLLEASSWIDRAEGNADAAVATTREALDAIGATITPESSAWLEATLGSHLIDQGNASEALAILESALQHAEAIESANRVLRAASHLAWARQLTGDLDGSRIALKQAQEVIGTVTAATGDVFLDGYRSYLAIARTCIALQDPRGALDVLVPLHAAALRHGWRDAAQQAADLLEVTSR